MEQETCDRKAWTCDPSAGESPGRGKGEVRNVGA